MSKLSEPVRGILESGRMIAIASAVGVAVIAAVCLIFSGLIISGAVPISWLVIFSAAACFFGGTAASVIVGRKGKMMVYSAACTVCITLILWLIGELFLGGSFAPNDNQFLILAVFLGCVSGSIIANIR